MPKQVVSCLFCGENPCACPGQKVSKKKLPVSKPSVSIPVPTQPSETDTSSTPEWFGSAKPKLAAPDRTQTQDELMLRQALLNLEEIMSPGSKEELKDIMHPRRDAKLSREGAEVRSWLTQ